MKSEGGSPLVDRAVYSEEYRSSRDRNDPIRPRGIQTRIGTDIRQGGQEDRSGADSTRTAVGLKSEEPRDGLPIVPLLPVRVGGRTEDRTIL
jgi:hypothetical protein